MNYPRVVVPIALLVAAIAATPAHAKSAKVKKATLSWSEVNTFNTAVAAPAERTWAGYVATFSKGTITPLSGASGQTVTATSATGLSSTYTQSFKGTKGKVDTKKAKGTIQFKGIVEFKAPLFTTTVENPKLVLKGKTGQLIASGKTDAPGTTYSSKRLLNFNLSSAKFSKKTKKLTIKGIVPSIATANLAFPANYLVGAGPDRTPNTFGTFSVTVSVK